MSYRLLPQLASTGDHCVSLWTHWLANQWFLIMPFLLHWLISILLSVQFSCSMLSDSATPWTAARQASLSITNSQSLLKLCPLSQWCHPTISSSVVPFSSCLQPFPASGPYEVNFLHQVAKILGVSAAASVLPVNTQDWSPLGWTGWISLQSKGLSRVFSNTTVQKHQFSGIQISL